jgi:Domain of unknown function (DUF5668)
MRVNRRFLYWGVFLVAVGGVLVAADLGALNAATIADALRLWPLAIIAIGLALVLRRTRYSVAGGMLGAAIPGLVLGGGFALVPHIAVDCGVGTTSSTVATHQGVFTGPARVSVTTGCGNLVVNTAPGAGWQLDAGSSNGRTPVIDASSRSLSIDAGSQRGWHFFFDSDGPNGGTVLDRSSETWRLTLPTSEIEDLSLVVNAGEGQIGLPGAQIGHLDLTTNAAKTLVDMTETSVPSMSGTVNAGILSLRLPATTDLVGSMEVNAGGLRVCVPNGLGLRVHHTGALSGIAVNGHQQGGSEWQSGDYASATHHADLNVNVNLGNVEINPIGGCK